MIDRFSIIFCAECQLNCQLENDGCPKDADFSDLILLHDPPPRVVHIKLENMKIREFHQNISKIWDEVCLLSKEYKLIRVYRDRIECID